MTNAEYLSLLLAFFAPLLVFLILCAVLYWRSKREAAAFRASSEMLLEDEIRRLRAEDDERWQNVRRVSRPIPPPGHDSTSPL